MVLYRLRREGRSGEGDGGRSAMTIVAIDAMKTAIGRSRRAAREARAGRCCRSENRDATFRDCRGDARRRSASRVGLGATFAARDARDSRSGACESIGRRGGEDVPRVGRDVTGQECMTRCRRGMPLCGKSCLLMRQPPSSVGQTFSRKLANDWLSFVAAAEFLKSNEIPSEVRFSIISVRFVCDFSQDRSERFDSLSAETIGESAVSTFRCSERARGFARITNPGVL